MQRVTRLMESSVIMAKSRRHMESEVGGVKLLFSQSPMHPNTAKVDNRLVTILTTMT